MNIRKKFKKKLGVLIFGKITIKFQLVGNLSEKILVQINIKLTMKWHSIIYFDLKAHLLICFINFCLIDGINLVAGRFLGFSVFISNTTNKEDGVLCFKDTNYTGVTIPNPINISCQYHGRYVIYYNNRTHPPFPNDYDEYAYNELCEVEVNGTRSFFSS